MTQFSGYKGLSPASSAKRTRVICTLGPSCWSVEMLGVLLDEGMNIARLNFSHGDHAAHKGTLDRLAEALAARPGLHCGVMLDTKGPEIRTGFFADPGSKLSLKAGATLILTADYEHKSDGTKLGCTYEKLAESCKPGQMVLVADGTLVLEVVSTDVAAKEVTCTVQNNVEIGERKNMNLPGVSVDLPVLQPKDVKDLLDFGIPNKVDFIAASFVQTGQDIRVIRETLGEAGKNIKIIAKIENQEGLDNLDNVIDETDAVMVARGDLGMEIPPEKVFRAQKEMITKCNRAGKPVIVATQMLESMCANPRPTRAECSDVANAVLDGADAVMLSGETAGGSHPKAAVAIMSRTCLEAEQTMDYEKRFTAVVNANRGFRPLSVPESICAAAVGASIDAGAKVIIVLAVTGRTASLLAKYRPSVPLVVVSADAGCIRQCKGLLSGVTTLHMPACTSYGYGDDTGTDEPVMIGAALDLSKEIGFLTSEDDVACAIHTHHDKKNGIGGARFDLFRTGKVDASKTWGINAKPTSPRK